MGDANTGDGWRSKSAKLSCGHVVLDVNQVHYCDWVSDPILEQLGAAFVGTAKERAAITPDELQFIRVHQQCEMAFKQITYDLRRAIAAVANDEYVLAIHILKRITQWTKVLTHLTGLFATMESQDFKVFRGALAPASGGESLGARRLEILAGILVDEEYAADRGRSFTYRQFLSRDIGPGENEPKTIWWTEELTELTCEQSLRQAFEEALVRENVTLSTLSTSPELETLARGMHAFDQNHTLWRKTHVELAKSLIGQRPGTGHTAGVPFLSSTLDKHLFRDLWEHFNPKTPREDPIFDR